MVVGGGSWGTAFANLLVDNGHDVTLACRDPEQAAAIQDTGRNPRYLTGVDLSRVSATRIEAGPFWRREPRGRRSAERCVRLRCRGTPR